MLPNNPPFKRIDNPKTRKNKRFENRKASLEMEKNHRVLEDIGSFQDYQSMELILGKIRGRKFLS